MESLRPWLLIVIAVPAVGALAYIFGWALFHRLRHNRLRRKLYGFLVNNASRRYTVGELAAIFPEEREYLFHVMHYLMIDGYIVDHLRSTDPADSRQERPRDRVEAMSLPNSLKAKSGKDLHGFLYEYAWSGKYNKRMHIRVSGRPTAV